MTKKRNTGKRKSSVKIALAQRMRALAQEIKKFPAETDIPIYKDVAGLKRKDPAIFPHPAKENSRHRHSGPRAGIHSNPTANMKKSNGNESGRTMLETLSVIAIVGLLSIMALSGFRYAMKKHRENESLDQISKTVVSSRTGFLLRAHGDSLDEVHEGGGLNYKMIGYVPKPVGIKDIMSAVDFNDSNKKKSSSDYTVQPETFRTLIGADVSVFVDTPYEYSVRVTRLYGDSGQTICKTILGTPFGESYVYVRDIKNEDYIPLNESRAKYMPADIKPDTEEASKTREYICAQVVAETDKPTDDNPNPNTGKYLVFVFTEDMGCTSGGMNVCTDDKKDAAGACCCPPNILDENGLCIKEEVKPTCPYGQILLPDNTTCCAEDKITGDGKTCCRSYDTPVGNTCCASPQVADNGQTCCASDEEVVNDSCCHWSRASTDEKTKKKVCCPADRPVRENICEIKRCDSTSDIYHPDVAFTDSGYPTLVKLGYTNILCCKGAYGTNGDMLFAHTSGTVDCCPVASSGGNMMFVKDPVYGSQGGQNKYTGKYFSLPYGTCEAYVPPVTDEITTSEETTDTDTDTDTDTEPEETSTEWCDYVCESDSSGYDPQACEEFCWWVNDPITNTRGEYFDRCCEPAAMSDNTCTLGQSYKGPTGNKTLGPVTDYCCQAAVDDNRTWWPNGTKVKACGNQCCSGDCINGVCCLNGGSGATEQGNGLKNNDCNNTCCPNGMACDIDDKTEKAICMPIDPDTITEITEETSIPESLSDDETTDPSGGGSEWEPQEPEDPSLDCSGDAYNPGYYMSKFCACCGRNSSYNYYCSDCSNPPNSWSDDGYAPEESESDGGLLSNPDDEEIAARCGAYGNGASAFCECCAANEDIKFEGDCNYYCYGYFYTTAW